MKQLLLIPCFFLAVQTTFSQPVHKSTYLIVRIGVAYNYNNDRFYTLNAEAGNPYADEVYRLLPYITKKDADHTKASFYDEYKNDFYYYNYFPNATEAILYLSEHGWQLVTVYNEIASGTRDIAPAGSLNYYPVTTVSSQPVYYFKKDL